MAAGGSHQTSRLVTTTRSTRVTQRRLILAKTILSAAVTHVVILAGAIRVVRTRAPVAAIRTTNGLVGRRAEPGTRQLVIAILVAIRMEISKPIVIRGEALSIQQRATANPLHATQVRRRRQTDNTPVIGSSVVVATYTNVMAITSRTPSTVRTGVSITNGRNSIQCVGVMEHRVEVAAVAGAAGVVAVLGNVITIYRAGAGATRRIPTVGPFSTSETNRIS